MSTPGLTGDSTIEIITAYSATNQSVPAVASAPGWYVVGEFFLPVSVVDAQLEAIGGVSDGSLVMSVRLYDMTALTPLSGTLATIGSVPDVRVTSGLVALTGGRTYQIQAQVVGNSGDAYFGGLKSAGLV